MAAWSYIDNPIAFDERRNHILQGRRILRLMSAKYPVLSRLVDGSIST